MKQQHKTKSLPQQATYWLGVIAVGLTVGLGIQFAQAWTNPGQAPEQGDIPGPITTGGDQTKDGSLRLSQNKNLSVGNAYLSSGGNYTHLANNEWFNGAAWVGTAPGALLQMNGQSVYFYRHDGKGNHSLLGTVASNGGVGGHYFYDLNNGNYYVDPTSDSRVVNVYADGTMNAHDYYIRAINRWASQLYGLGNLSGGGGVNYFRGNTNVDLGWHKLCYINYLHIQEDDFICNLYVDGYDNGRYHWRMGFYSEKNMSCQTYCLD
jgi:hypothetical protein